MTSHAFSPLDGPPEASPRAAALARRLLSPVERFLHIEAASGIVLLVTTAIALVLANTSLRDAYHHVLEAPIGVRLGSWQPSAPLHFFINDGLMTIFFFVVGLEIKREIHAGELSNLRRASLPIAAALGGMIAPACLYLALASRAEPRGWGVPMATDIAFAVGVLALLGSRVPPAVRVLLLALAIIDDIGSIVVIAAFYSGPLTTSGFVVAGAGIAAILVMQRLGVRRSLLYVVPGVVVWLGILRSGVHPTIAGVIVGLLTPARAWLGAEGLVGVARTAADRVTRELDKGVPGEIAQHSLLREAVALDQARREAFAPAVRLQVLLHPWVAFLIMPVFALANAGVTVPSTDALVLTRVSVGVVVGLVVGKPVGILLACLLATKLLGAVLPRAVGFRELVVLGIVAGIGFTMALFVSALAFSDAARLDEAKLAVLVASGVAMLASLVLGRILLRPGAAARGAATEAVAEASDES